MNNKEPEQFLVSTSKGEGSYFLLVNVITSFVVPVVSLYNLCFNTAFYARDRQKNPYLQHEGHRSINTITFQRHFNLEIPLWSIAENVLQSSDKNQTQNNTGNQKLQISKTIKRL
jgi:hypothetical protein